jgi:hypothetical protein
VTRRKLHKRTVRRWHRLAAILTVVTMRRAMHRIAALHRLFRRRRGITVERIRRKGDCEDRPKNWTRKTHYLLA